MKETKDYNQINNDFKQYNHAWQEMMITIWKDRFKLLGTGVVGNNIANNIRGRIEFMQQDFSSFMQFEMPKHAIYWMMGVGNGYTPGNGGDLKFLDPVYRAENDLDIPRLASKKSVGRMTSGDPRQRHLAPIKSYAYSKKVLADACSRILGDAFIGMFDELNGDTNIRL